MLKESDVERKEGRPLYLAEQGGVGTKKVKREDERHSVGTGERKGDEGRSLCGRPFI